MITLAIDTATVACSVALFEGDRLQARAHAIVGRGHAEQLLPMIADLPDGGRADLILVDVGPGSFTGVRVGVAAARALALGWEARVAGYSSLALLAAAAFARGTEPAFVGVLGTEPAFVGVLGTEPALVAVLEGGHGEVFMQGFTASPLVAVDALASRPPAVALAVIGTLAAIGEGTRRLAPLAPGRAFKDALPDAADVLLLPPAFRALSPRPLYGRAPDARVPGR